MVFLGMLIQDSFYRIRDLLDVADAAELTGRTGGAAEDPELLRRRAED